MTGFVRRDCNCKWRNHRRKFGRDERALRTIIIKLTPLLEATAKVKAFFSFSCSAVSRLGPNKCGIAAMSLNA